MFSSLLKYFANAAYFYMKTEMVYSSFSILVYAHPEQLTVILFHTGPPWEYNPTTLTLQEPCSTNWAISQTTWCLNVLKYCVVHCFSSWWWKVYRYKPRWPAYNTLEWQSQRKGQGNKSYNSNYWILQDTVLNYTTIWFAKAEMLKMFLDALQTSIGQLILVKANGNSVQSL